MGCPAGWICVYVVPLTTAATRRLDVWPSLSCAFACTVSRSIIQPPIAEGDDDEDDHAHYAQFDGMTAPSLLMMQEIQTGEAMGTDADGNPIVLTGSNPLRHTTTWAP